MPDFPSNPDSPPRRPWVPPTLTRHASLTALTQVQDPAMYPPGMYPPGMSPYPAGFGPYADIPCSQGFCP